MSRQWLRVGALGMAMVLAGCVSAPLTPTVKPQGPAAEAPAECTAPASSEDGVARLARAVGYGTVSAFVFVLQGAYEGATWALVAGGSMSDGAWIGAAAGAGVGFLIGFVAGLAKAGSGWGGEPASAPPCPPGLVEVRASVEDH